MSPRPPLRPPDPIPRPLPTGTPLGHVPVLADDGPHALCLVCQTRFTVWSDLSQAAYVVLPIAQAVCDGYPPNRPHHGPR